MMLSSDAPLLEVTTLSKQFAVRRRFLEAARRRSSAVLRALESVSFAVRRGETLGVVGESGCGKSTLARCLVRLHEPDGGGIRFDGQDVLTLQGSGLRRYHRRVQMAFQDPYSSLNPRMTVGHALAEAIRFHDLRPPAQTLARVAELLELVGLPTTAAERYPREFSGGQRQRIGIARALAVEPDLLIADEIVSALDVSVQAQIINLLLDLQERLHLTILFIAHDLRVVRHLSHRVAVMYLGSIVEIGETEQLFARPRHPYTAALLAAAPEMDPGRRGTRDAISGELPSPFDIPTGCAFRTRCSRASDRCAAVRPTLAGAGGRMAACHHPLS
ncbi:MAG TPA: oligopeptide/dipeptide ABC transporter ATP-binding protein [Candidatus Acidoferrum sp.]|nr:oligopeptide/dipeptide ABC transporter ATP-binding protein [Candidatus Acidoferrum sp.]